ncbi:MAG: hypothetical protein NC177_16645 [Ruminococcus flavefaciens]|nr:hypothetical protein [Ruminococcus flavefaciens]
MNINIINQTSYNQIKIIYNKDEVILKKDESKSFLVTSVNSNFEVFVLEKNRVLFNLLFALVDGFIDGESVINSLVCSASFNIDIKTNTTIVLKDLEYRDDKNGYIYESIYIDCDKNMIENLTYKLISIEKARKRSMFYYICVVSWLPILMILVGRVIYNGNILALIASIVVLLIFSLPSWKKASKVKIFYSNEYASKCLKEKIEEMSFINNNEQTTDYPKDVIGKATYKLLDKLFKKNNQ